MRDWIETKKDHGVIKQFNETGCWFTYYLILSRIIFSANMYFIYVYIYIYIYFMLTCAYSLQNVEMFLLKCQ